MAAYGQIVQTRHCILYDGNLLVLLHFLDMDFADEEDQEEKLQSGKNVVMTVLRPAVEPSDRVLCILMNFTWEALYAALGHAPCAEEVKVHLDKLIKTLNIMVPKAG